MYVNEFSPSETKLQDFLDRYSIPYLKNIIEKFIRRDYKSREKLYQEIIAYKKIYGHSLLLFKYEINYNIKNGDDEIKYFQVLDFDQNK